MNIYQWKSCGVLHFGCIQNKIGYWRTYGTGEGCDKWDICTRQSYNKWRAIADKIPPLQYLVITGEHFDIEKVIEEANR